MDEIKEPGNEAEPSGELREDTAETHDAEPDSRGDQKPEDWKQRYLKAKEAEERANALARENAELKERLQQPPAAADDDDDGDDVDWAEVEKYAKAGDQVARAQLRYKKEREKERAEREELVTAIVLRDQLNEIEDKPTREAVRDRYLKNRSKYRDIRDALRDHRLEAIEAENEKLRREIAAREPDKDVVRTHHREVGAQENKIRKWTRAKWEKEQAGADTATRMQQQRDYRAGKIVVEG